METTTTIDVRKEVLAAEKRIRPYVLETPVEHSLYFSNIINGTVHLKLDLYQTTGSFKYRGATSKIMSLSEEELDRGIVSASTGNFALALAQAMKNVGREATVYLAKDLPEARMELIRSHGLNIVVYGDEAWDAEKKAREVADTEGKIYASPYNDPVVVGGQGTCGLEIERQIKDADTVIIACGGGGLLTGSGGYLKTGNPEINIIGVSPENSPIMYESVKQGKMIEMGFSPTLADTCAGGVDLDTITFGLCQKYVDEMALVSEEEIKNGIKILFEQHRLVSEGSAALSIAYLLKNKDKFEGKNVVLVVCGMNIGIELFKSIIL